MTDPRRLSDSESATSPALRSLLESAKHEDEPHDQRVAALSARLAPLMIPLAAPPPAAPVASVVAATKTALVAKVGSTVLAVGFLGGGVWYLRDRSSVTQGPPARASEHMLTPRLPPTPPATPEAPPKRPLPQPALSAPARPAPARAAPRTGEQATEAALVQSAQAALLGDDVRTALELTREHATRFSSGAHAEERDRIAIEALLRLGRTDDARAAATRFFGRYPRSIYRARVEALLP